MDLDTYLNAEGIKGVDFAAQLEISEASLTRIRRGEQNIPRDLIRKIVTLTGGQVTAMALVFPGDHDAGSIPAGAGPATGQIADLSGGGGSFSRPPMAEGASGTDVRPAASMPPAGALSGGVEV